MPPSPRNLRRLSGWFVGFGSVPLMQLGPQDVVDSATTVSPLGLASQATWADVTAVELIKPMNQIGWGVRFRIPTMKPASVIVWLGNRRLAERLIQSCALRRVPTEVKARAVL